MEKDRGWAWVVAAGSFIAMLLEVGMVKSLGVLLPELREQFAAQTWAIGLAISLLPGFGAVTCVAATGLRRVVSSRFIMISFSVLSSLGLLLISLSWSVPVLAIGVILAGFSCGAEATTFSILPVYFDKYYDISNSIAHAGLSVGVMTMPLLTQFLLDNFGWRGTMLILAALNANTVLIGVIVKDTPSNIADSSQAKKHQMPDRNALDISSHSKSKRKTKLTIVSTFNLDFFKNLRFISMMCVTFGNGFYFTGWLIYLVPHAENLGFSPYASSAIATTGGIGNLAGSCAFPFLSKVISSKSMIYIFHFIASLSLATDPIVSLGPFYIGLMASSFLLNFANGIWGCAFIKECAHIFEDKDHFHSILGWAYFCYGIGSVLSGFTAGWFFDKYNNYTASFLCLSIITVVSLTPMCVQQIISLTEGPRYSAISKEDQDED